MALAAGGERIMVEQQQQQGQPGGSEKHIVFFDVETTVPTRAGQRHELLEFAGVVLDARGLGELRSFHTLIRPKNPSSVNRRTTDCNGITQHTVAHAPTFADVADDIHSLLDGHIWAGHNILKFDIVRINEAFSESGRQAPQHRGVIDTYPLLRKTFGKRAGNYKLATLANYCGYGKQEHRSLADVRMNMDVLRSCATMLFLESNYPDIFTAQHEVFNYTSTSEQSATLSASYWQSRRSGNEDAEQGVDFESKLSESAAESSESPRPYQELSRNQLLSVMKDNAGLSEVTDLIGESTNTVESKLAKIGALNETRKECSSSCELQHQTFNSNSRDVVKDEQGISSESIAVSSFFKNNHFQGHVLTGFKHIDHKMGAAEVILGEFEKASSKAPSFVVNKKSSSEEKGELYDAPAVEDSSSLDAELVDNSEKAVNEEDYGLSEALISLSLKGSHDVEASGCTSTKPDQFSSMVVHWSNADSRADVEGGPFLLASRVTLASLELQEESSRFGCSKVLYHKGFPLHLLECKIRIRFTVNLSYAFDDKGKPRFSVLVEPSEAACEVIRKCEDVVKSKGFTSAYGGEVEWLPALRKETGAWAARMSIGTKGVGPSATYTTKFYNSTSDGVEEISLGHVNVSTFTNVVPHGSIVDVGFGFYVFNVNNRAGVKLMAKHITLTGH